MAPESNLITEELLRGAVASASKRNNLVQIITPRVRSMVLIRLAPTRSQMHAVEDLSQQCLMAIADGICRLRAVNLDSFRSFTSRIVAHKVADFLRKAQSSNGARHASLESSVDAMSSVIMLKDLLPASGLSVGTIAARTELIDQILSELKEMSPRNREVITLAFFDQLTVSQIAECMEVSRAAASMLLLRSVKMLRSRIARRLGPEIRHVL